MLVQAKNAANSRNPNKSPTHSSEIVRTRTESAKHSRHRVQGWEKRGAHDAACGDENVSPQKDRSEEELQGGAPPSSTARLPCGARRRAGSVLAQVVRRVSSCSLGERIFVWRGSVSCRLSGVGFHSPVTGRAPGLRADLLLWPSWARLAASHAVQFGNGLLAVMRVSRSGRQVLFLVTAKVCCVALLFPRRLTTVKPVYRVLTGPRIQSYGYRLVVKKLLITRLRLSEDFLTHPELWRQSPRIDIWAMQRYSTIFFKRTPFIWQSLISSFIYNIYWNSFF